MDRVRFGKRFVLLLLCFAFAMWIGYRVGVGLPPSRVVLMPWEQVDSDTPWVYAMMDRLRKPAWVLVAWYIVSLISVGTRCVAKAIFPWLTVMRGFCFGVCLAMVYETHTVMGTALVGLGWYLMTSVLLMGFAAGESAGSFGRTTGRFLTHAGAVFAMTLVLGVI